MNFHIHPDYIELKDLIYDIPEGKYRTRKVHRNIRNTVEDIILDDKIYVLKKYKVPNWINQIAYSLFRKSKARRSFEYAQRLLENGIETAKPVAYIEERNFIFFRDSYFISEYIDHPVINDVDFLYIPGNEQLREDFISFTANLHDRQIIHKDYNASNIFYYKQDDHYKFALVDINRMKFGKGSLWLYMKIFNQLDVKLSQMYDMIGRYAIKRELDIADCLTVLLLHRKYFEFRSKSKDFLKVITRNKRRKRKPN